ncbi:hypothetical protein [Roseomonas chloroacetimidivorans]|uniref:hypothetical protein n=1 Tax=Roseomonas chloroacetimidivorans TaxID=1766656 RepID=UPI003C757442
MSVHDAKPGDVYADANGKLWRVIGVWHDPTVEVEEVEPERMLSPKQRRFGGVGGLMWQGFQRIWSKKEATTHD